MTLCLLFAAFGLRPASAQGGGPGLTQTVELTATVDPSAPSITLHFPVDPNATSYTITRHVVGDPGFPTTLPAPANPATANSYTDNTVTVGVAYEYSVSKGSASGFIVSGIAVPLPGAAQDGNRGKMILIVANDALADPRIAAQIPRMVQDLTGDGWTVIQHNVPRDLDYNDAGVLVDKGAGIRNVKALIRADYNADPANVKSVFLFGHVPIAYSGLEAPDGHSDHVGAWAADTYYSDMGPESNWTDTGVDNTTSGDKRNWNVPGDGKFDQSFGPAINFKATASTPATLEVGRVDLWNMPSFNSPPTGTTPKSEFDLLSQYLDKDHNFHQGFTTANPVGRITDVFGSGYDSVGYDNFSPFFGPNAITISNQGVPSVLAKDETTGSFLWTYGDGPGNPQSSGGVVMTSDFVVTDPHSMFFMLFGSFLGDWGFTDNVMRAALCTPTYGLSCTWGDRPSWFFQHMGLGYEMGFSELYTESVSGNPVWASLMGDPSLRQDPVLPASNLNAVAKGADVTLTWTTSPQIGNYGTQISPVIGYNVYRLDSVTGSYTLLNTSGLIVPAFAPTPSLPFSSATFTDTGAAGTAYTYQVRAVALQTTLSGTYYNQSEGIFQAYNPTHVAPTLTLVSPVAPPRNTVLFGTANSSPGAFFGATATTPAIFTIAADAATSIPNDANLTVSFYQDSKFLGSTMTAPYQFTVTAPIGDYTYYAVATDGSGATVGSNILPVYVFNLGEALDLGNGAAAPHQFSAETIFGGPSSFSSSLNPLYTDLSNKNQNAMTDAFGSSDEMFKKTPTIAVTLNNAGSSFVLGRNTPIDTTQFPGIFLELFLNGGKTGGQKLTITAPIQDSQPPVTVTLNNDQAGFTKVSIPLGSYAGSGGRQRSFDGFTITDATGGKNTPTFYIGDVQLGYTQIDGNPTPGVAVHLTNQPNVNAVYTAGAPIRLAGDAATNSGSITEVDLFLVNGTTTTYLGRATGMGGSNPYSPFTYTLTSSLPVGTYQLRAESVSSFGATNFTGPGHLYSPPSPDVTFTVANPPTVSITAPANNAGYVLGSTIPITATAAASGGANLAKVQFFESADGGVTETQIGADQTTAPFTVNFTPTMPGNYTLTAVATDDGGGVTTSQPVTIYVGTPATVTITSPTDGSKFSAPTSFSPKVFVQEGTYVLAKLQIYNGSTLLYTQNFPPGSIPPHTSITIFTEGFPALPAGTYSLTAVASDIYGISGTSAPVNITVVGPPTIAITSPANNAQFPTGTAIPITAAATASAGANITKVQFFQSANGGAATQIGADQTTAPYGVTFTPAAPGQYTLTAEVFDDAGQTATSAPVVIHVGTPPTVAITAPANGAVFAAPATFPVTASASAAAGQTIAQVQFFANGKLIGTAATAPYTVSFASVPVGTYSLTAVATDNFGLTTTSAAVAVTVANPPMVAITAPKTGAIFAAPATFPVTANAAAGSNPITKVDFFANGKLIGTATTAPYTVSFANVPAGTYSLTARATDSIGLTATSAAVTVTVETPPTVAITAPANNAAFATGSDITVTASATAGGSPITQVQFFANGTTLIGTATAAPYTVTFAGVAAGTYTLTAVVTDSAGLSITSAPVTIKVANPPTVVLTTPANNSAFAAPATFPVSATATAGTNPITQVQFFANGKLIGTATTAPYTVSFANVPVGTYTLTAVVTDSIGLSATSAPITVTVSNPPAVAITAPANGTVFAAPATITVSATATAGSHPIAQVQFFANGASIGTAKTAPYTISFANVPAGTYSLTAVATDTTGLATTSAAVGITVATPPSVVISAPAAGATFNAPASIPIVATATPGSNPIAQVQFFANGKLIGTATAGPYRVVFTGVPAGTYSLTAVVTDSAGLSVTSAPVSVTVVVAPPSVAISSPTAGASFNAPATFPITASVTPGTNPVKQVQFFANGTLIGTATAAPYTISFANVPAGTYSLTAVATDTAGLTATSSAVSVTVNTAPTVTITAPTNGAVFGAPATIPVTASVTPGSSPIAQVQFFANGAPIGTAKTAPYTVSFTNAPAGNFTLTAKVTDTAGLSATSAPVSITVSTPPTVAITAPTDGSAFPAPATVVITATAAGGANPVAKVDFFANGKLVGTATTAPYTATLTNAPVGTYTLTAVATDTTGLAATSAAVTITVVTPQPVYGLVSRSFDGKAVTGATVTFTNSATGAVTTATTGAASVGADGKSANYSVSTLVTGSYTVTLTAPGYLQAGSQTIQVTAGQPARVDFTLSPLHTFPSGLQMFSLPYDYSASGLGIADILAVPMPKVVLWDPASAYGSATTFTLGRGYWGYFPIGANLVALGKAAPTNAPFSVSLSAGWNIIGDPFLSAAPLNTIQVTGSGGPLSLQAAASQNLVSANLYTYNQGTGQYDLLPVGGGGSLSTYGGYWIHASNNCSLVVPAPGPPVGP